MSVSMQAGGFTVTALASHPIIGDGTPSSAVLSNVSLVSGDINVFIIDPDPATPDGFIFTSVNAGTAGVTGTALATELDGTTHTISLTPDTVTVTVPPPPPPPPAVAFGLVFGAPQPPAAA